MPQEANMPPPSGFGVEDGLPIQDGVPDEAVVAAVEVAVERVEIERYNAAAASREIEDGGAANELFLTPSLAADDEG